MKTRILGLTAARKKGWDCGDNYSFRGVPSGLQLLHYVCVLRR